MSYDSDEERKERIFERALLSHADKENADIPYPDILNNVLRELEKDPERPYLPSRRRTIPEIFVEFIRDCCKPPVVMAAAVAAVFTLAVALGLVCKIYCYSPTTINELIDLSYNGIEVRYRENLSSEFSNLRFSGTSNPSLALQAFNAGLWKGKQFLLPSSEGVGDKHWLKKDWSKTQWATYYELGRWTLLLESVCRQDEVPNGFWERQKTIFAQLNQAIFERQDKKDELEGVVIDWVLSQFEEEIGPLLEPLPGDKKPAYYAKLAEKLKFMMDGLIIT